MVLNWPIWAKISQNLDVKNKFSASGTGPPPPTSGADDPIVIDIAMTVNNDTPSQLPAQHPVHGTCNWTAPKRHLPALPHLA